MRRIRCNARSCRPAATASFVIPPLTVAFPVQVVDTFKDALAAMALGEATPAEFVQMLIDANNR